MLREYLNDKHFKKETIERARTKFEQSAPFPHLILGEFLQENFIHEVAQALRKLQFHEQNTDLFRFLQSDDIHDAQNPTLRALYDVLNSSEMKELVYNITGAKAPGKIDCAAFIYRSKDYLLPHDDKLETRKIAYVLNLSKGFTKRDGGTLDLFDSNKIVKSILPSFNTLVLFRVTANKTIHQVSEVLTEKERLSVTGWFHDS